jgi:hypothetical protein
MRNISAPATVGQFRELTLLRLGEKISSIGPRYSESRGSGCPAAHQREEMEVSGAGAYVTL